MDRRMLMVAMALPLLLVTDASRSHPWSQQEFAHHGAETSPDGYYGFIATFDLYGFALKHGQGTAGAVWIAGSGAGPLSGAKTIIIGWNCPGFQPEKGAHIAPGDAFEHVSTPNGGKQNLSLKVVKDGGASGDWLVYLGLNRDPELIGRFPRSLFTGVFADKAIANTKE
ncbi:unnamed protein product [Urochloa decumbens]|uniref:Neprosin PEP catalytic domain-containing protein n=1 Tax=Urochloa decumbens TaxID=240449 RepID=A0ABC8ZRG3_9POAL